MSCAKKRRASRGLLISAVAIAATVLPSATVAFTPSFVEGQVVISEIMYDVSGTDTDREWVEVFNAGGSSVHLTDWKFFEANTNHGVTSVQGGENLGSGAYAVIAGNPTKFLQDWPSYSGILFDSAFSLGNSGETLGIHMPPPDLTETDVVAYQSAWGATGNSNSLQRTSASGSTFAEASPTPGTGPLTSSGGGDSSGSDGGATTTSTQSASSGGSSEDSIMPPPPKVSADGGGDRTVIVGADTEFKARAYDQKKNLIEFSRFHWNFGDGSTSEIGTVLHRFDYSGRYVVVLTIPEEKDSVLDQIIVTVEPMKLALSLLSDGGVAIENRAGRTIDLSRWILRSMGRAFSIPEKTFILANNTFRMSQRTLGFSSGADIELAYPNGTLALGIVSVAAPTSTPPALVPATTSRVRTTVESETVQGLVAPLQEENAAAEQIETTSSTTSVSSTQVAAAATPNSSPLWWFGIIGIAGLAAGSLVVARRFGKREWDIVEETAETR